MRTGTHVLRSLKLLIVSTAASLVLFLYLFLLHIEAINDLQRLNVRRFESYQLANELRQSSDDLTRMVRTYVATGDLRYKQQFEEIIDIRDGHKPRPLCYGAVYWDLVMSSEQRPCPMGESVSLLARMSQQGFTTEELQVLERAKQASDALTHIEYQAMRLIESRSPALETRLAALELLHDERYHQAKMAIMQSIAEFLSAMDRRTSLGIEDAQGRALTVRIAFMMSGALVLLFCYQLLQFLYREKYQRALSEQKLSTIVETLPIAVILSDQAFNVTYVNQAFTNIFGFIAPDIKNLNDLFPPTTSGAMEKKPLALNWKEKLIANSEASEVIPIEWTIACQDGQQRTVEVHTTVNHDTRGNLEYLITLLDVTNNQQQKALFAEQQQRIENIIAGANLGTWEWNVQTGETIFNDRWAEIVGYKLEELKPVSIQTWLDLAHPDDLKRSGELLNSHFNGESPFYECESRMRHKEGHWVWVMDRGRVMTWTDDGQPLKMSGTHQDITEHKRLQADIERSQAALKLSEERLSLAICSVNDGIWDWDLKTGEVYYSLQWKAMLGYADKELNNDFNSFKSLIHADDLPLVMQALDDYMSGHISIYAVEFRMRTREGDWRWILSRGQVMLSDKGIPYRMIGSHSDIDHQKRNELELLAIKDAAESANRAKSEFLANMSHEIRTPLNALIGMAYLLDQSELDADQKSTVDAIQTASRSLLGIVNDVLDMSKIEAGEFDLEIAPFDLDEILQDLRDLLTSQAHSKQLALVIEDTPEDVPRYLNGDAVRLRQILVNLLGNSLKFTLQGFVSLKLWLVSVQDDAVRIRFEVEDSGIGITPAAMDTLFSPFTQADNSTTRRFGGTGLGLFIVKQMVNLMGGDIDVDRDRQSGSRFWLELPFNVSEEELDRLQPTGMVARPLEVLVVISDGELCQSLMAMIGSLGWRGYCIHDGDILVETALTRHRELQRIDCLIIEWPLPGTDIQQDLVTLKNSLANEEMPACLLVSQESLKTLQQLPVTELIDGILPLPLESTELFRHVNTVVTHRVGQPERVFNATHLEQSRFEWLAGLQILLVDDSELNIDVSRRLLSRQGADVAVCNNGKEALAWLDENYASVDVVVMDIQMPVMDGNSAARLIRLDPRTGGLPLIALTAGALLSEREKALECGFDDYLTKPINPQLMIRAIRRLVERNRGENIPLRLLEQSIAEDVAWPIVDGITSADARSLTNNDLELFLSTLARLLKEFADYRHAITDEIIDERYRHNLAAHMHKLAGNAGLVGANALRSTALGLESLAHDGNDALIIEGIKTLAEHVDNLQASADPILSQHSQQQTEQLMQLGQNAPLLDFAERRALIQMLQEKNLKAKNLFRQVSPMLLAELGPVRFEILKTAMEQLNYNTALAILDA